ncbi:MAG: thymidine phosphorylase [bacterium]|nr:thymidine phosphorylase [bacterium]
MNDINKTKRFSAYELISKKRDGYELTTGEMEFFIDGYVKGEIPDYQAAAFLMAAYLRGINQRELTDLTRIMIHSGDTISLEGIGRKHIDKHSTGGVGDKISFVVAPLVAACGVGVPMLSGRSLGHTGGTLDKLESIPGFDVFLKTGDFKKVLADVGMVINGQTENIVPADRKLYALRDATATVSNIPLIAASIMSKKLALGTDGIILDIKTGSGAFMRRLDDSVELAKTMVGIGEKSGRTTIGLVTGMDQPLGEAVGNSLEIIESIETLKGNGPEDVKAVTFGLGAAMLIAAGAETDYNDALEKLETTLDSGKPLEIFRKCISAQKGNANVCDDYSLLPQSKHRVPLNAETDGFIAKINTMEVGMTAIDIGGGRRSKEDHIDHSAGFIFHKKIGDQVKKGEAVLTIYTNRQETVDAAKQRLSQAIAIMKEKPSPEEIIRYIVDKNGMRDWEDR